jgi:predicted glutamine amidotransferase
MCIAILNKTSVLTLDVIKNSFENNPDGAGLCAVIDGKLKIYKELKSANYKSFYAEYLKMREKTDKPVLLHFRIGTSGIKDERNIHPFLINAKLALIHNGMINYNVVDNNFSDTWHFTQLLKSLRNPAKLLNEKSLEYQMLSAFTKSSKIAILHVSGQYSILNESAGKWSNDTWYSNETYKSCNYRNVGGKIIYNNSTSHKSSDLWGIDERGYYGYGYGASKLPSIKNIEPVTLNSDKSILPRKTFDYLEYARKQMKCISIAKGIFGEDNYIFSVSSYSTCLNSLFELYRASTLYDLYEMLCADNILTNQSEVLK